MHRADGYTLIELLIALSVIGTLSAVAMPVVDSTMRLTTSKTGEQAVAGQLRKARLDAVKRDARVRVAFNCPGAGAVRILSVTGDSTVDNSSTRCTTTLANDGQPIWLPSGVTVSSEGALEFDSVGTMTPVSGVAPATISVANSGITRSITVSGSGRVTVNP